MNITMPPKVSRKANYSLPESRFLVEKFKTHAAYFESNWNNGSRFEKTEVWQDIYDQYREQFPHMDRTALDIRRKLIKLRSEAKMIMQREQLKAQGANIHELLSDRTMKLAVSPGHRMMIKAMMGEEDWSAENGDFVEYEVEFDDDAENNIDLEYVTDGDQEASGSTNPEKIIKKLFLPGANPISMASTTQKHSSIKHHDYSCPEPSSKKRKQHHVNEAPASSNPTSDVLLELQKQKLKMERRNLSVEWENLHLMQRKLKLEVRLLEHQVAEIEGSSGGQAKKLFQRSDGSVKSHGDVIGTVDEEETIAEGDEGSSVQENGQENGQEVEQETQVPDEEAN
ncbi:uncharacterized protein LOC121430821 [Lytechinus variegatus]|uniref:uncharacterized protein LOC121430821 n=1 Tax=Lytechinus variegatus TaxID=7654 RepID=UPI001BB16DF6|nr:uncharacterized protein LOC121430821 [Lytechinus variegatus]